jgi:hypothetical protein
MSKTFRNIVIGLSIVVIAFFAVMCTGAGKTEGEQDSTAVDTTAVQSVNEGVEGVVPTDSVK